MSVNEKVVSDIARQMGVSVNNNKKIIENWQGKSDKEIMSEIVKIQKQLEDNNITRQQQTVLLRQLLPMLQDKEKARLQKVIEQIGIKL